MFEFYYSFCKWEDENLPKKTLKKSFVLEIFVKVLKKLMYFWKHFGGEGAIASLELLGGSRI
jgi:hypothetical protein